MYGRRVVPYPSKTILAWNVMGFVLVVSSDVFVGMVGCIFK